MMSRYKQQGSVLIISLVLLLVLTILGISSMDNTIMEEKMAGNLYQSNVAFQNAEMALRFAEADIMSLSKTTKIIGSNCGANGVWNGVAGGSWLVDEDDPCTESSHSVSIDKWSVAKWMSKTQQNATLATPTSGTAFRYPAGATSPTGFYFVEELSPICDSLSVGQQQDQLSCTDQYQVTAMGLGPGDRLRAYVRSTLLRRY